MGRIAREAGMDNEGKGSDELTFLHIIKNKTKQNGV